MSAVKVRGTKEALHFERTTNKIRRYQVQIIKNHGKNNK